MRGSFSAALLVARLLARALALGRPEPVATEERLRNVPMDGAPLAAPVEIRRMTDPTGYLGAAGAFIDRVLAGAAARLAA